LKDFAADPTAIAQYQFQKITDLKRADYMVEIDFKPGMTYFSVIRIAMKLEEKGNKMYTKMAESAGSEDMSNVFLILAQEEMKHKNQLETIYDDHLAKTGD
jgi:rubrerythrin